MPQFFIDRSLDAGSETEISGRDAHHIIDVLRLKVGDRLVLSDGNGRSFRSKITSIGPKRVRAIVEEETLRRQVAAPPALSFAVIKYDRSEWIIQKAVELGVKHIIPFYCRRTIPKYTSAQKKHGRWQGIALEAAKQSGLPFMPQVELPCDFDKLCSSFSNYEKTILFWEGEQNTDLKSLLNPPIPPLEKGGEGRFESRVLLVIGPEGGFEESEVAKAKDMGAVTVSLGSQILRVETAAIVALAIIQYELGNLGCHCEPEGRGNPQIPPYSPLIKGGWGDFRRLLRRLRLLAMTHQ